MTAMSGRLVGDLGESGLVGRDRRAVAVRPRRAARARATTPPWSRRRTAAWSRPPTCWSRACTSAGTGPTRRTSGTRRPRRTWPTSPRWARGRRPCSSAWRPPASLPVAWALGLADGLAAEAQQAGAAVVGGDVVSGEQVVVSVTALGDAGRTGAGHPVRCAGRRRRRARRAAGLVGRRARGAQPRVPVAAGAGGGAPPAGAGLRRRDRWRPRRARPRWSTSATG